VFDVIGKKRWFFAFSLLITIPGLIFILLTPITGGEQGLKFSIDYTGGTTWSIRFADAAVTADDVRAELATLDADDEMGGRLQIATAQGLVDELMDLADGCPACVFAALRQTGRLAYQEEKEPFSMVSFRYQHEMQEFWERRRDDDDYRDMMANCY